MKKIFLALLIAAFSGAADAEIISSRCIYTASLGKLSASSENPREACQKVTDKWISAFNVDVNLYGGYPSVTSTIDPASATQSGFFWTACIIKWPAGQTNLGNISSVCSTPPTDIFPQTCTPADGLLVGHPILPSSGEKLLQEEDYAGSQPAALDFERRWLSSWALAAGVQANDATTTNTTIIRPAPSQTLGAGWSHNHIGTISPAGQALATAPLITVHLPEGNSRTFSKNAAGAWQAAGHPELQLILAANGAATLSDSRANIRLDFDAAGRMIAHTARNGWQTTYTYNTSGQLTRIQNAFGRTLTLAYTAAGANGLLASVTTPDGLIRYEYETAAPTAGGQRRLTGIIYPDGSRKTYLYENTAFPHLITGTIDQNGKRLATYAYDRLGRATSTQWAHGADTYSASYSGNNPPGANQSGVTITDPLGTKRSYAYQFKNGQIAVSSANLAPANAWADPIRARTQDAQGNITAETTFAGSRTDYQWNARQLPTQIVRAAGRTEQQSTVYEWHPTLSVPTQIIDGKTRTTLSYDDKGNLLARTVADSSNPQTSLRWTYTYTAQGLLATETDPSGATTTYGYDAQGNLTTVKNPLGHTTGLSYDAAGRVTHITDPNGLQIR